MSKISSIKIITLASRGSGINFSATFYLFIYVLTPTFFYSPCRIPSISAANIFHWNPTFDIPSKTPSSPMQSCIQYTGSDFFPSYIGYGDTSILRPKIIVIPGGTPLTFIAQYPCACHTMSLTFLSFLSYVYSAVFIFYHHLTSYPSSCVYFFYPF